MKEVEEIKVDEIYSGNVTDKTQKIRLGYLMLGTMEEKVDYILKLSALQSIAEMEKKPVSNQEKDMVETLQEELCKEYLTKIIKSFLKLFPEKEQRLVWVFLMIIRSKPILLKKRIRTFWIERLITLPGVK